MGNFQGIKLESENYTTGKNEIKVITTETGCGWWRILISFYSDKKTELCPTGY